MTAVEYFTDLKRCTNCILPENFPGIRFNEEGVCNYCEEYEKVEVKGEAALEEFLSRFRGVGRDYDCIAPISGGRDSAFVLHQMIRKYGMRVLALTVDRGGILPEGYRNIDKMVKVLDVEHVWLKDDDQIAKAHRNTRIKFKAWMKKLSINTIVPVLNVADKTMNLRIYRYAHEHGIPLVVGGNNIGNSSFEQERFKTGFMGVFPDDRGRYSLMGKLRLSIFFAWEFLKNTYNWDWSVFKEYVQGTFIYFFESLQRPRDVTPLGFFDYIYWDEGNLLSTIVNELDWVGASDTIATWRIDDAAYPLIDYIYYSLVGFNEFDEHYIKLVREGQITREEALARLETDGVRISLVKASLKDLGVDDKELDAVLSTYRDFLLKQILN